MSRTAADQPTVVGVAQPVSRARMAQHPLDARRVRLTGGILGDWQQRNHQVSLPSAIERLESAGNMDNLRLVTGEFSGEYRGPRFMDSDLYKTLEAIGWDLGRDSDDRPAERDLVAFVEQATALLGRAQRADGYLNSHYQAVEPERQYAFLAHSHEMYCAGHLIQAAVAVARTSGDTGLLDVARRFADHLVRRFLRDQDDGIDGHPEIETALVELYRHTREESYLRLAERLVDNRGRGHVGDGGGVGVRYFQDHAPVREAETLVGHAVRALYLDAGVVDLYLENGDESLLDCSVRRWEDMVATKVALTGGLGSRHAREAFGDAYELPPDRCYNETCAAIASIQWSWRLLLATGQARYADLIERTLYNAFAASTSADGERFFYVNPLQRRPDHYEGDDPGRRHEWFSCACCPPNIMRLVSSFGHYLASTADDGTTLHLHQYAPGELTADLSGGAFGLEVQTGYPFDGEIRITVTRAPEGEAGLALRIPGWSGRTELTIGDEAVPVRPNAQGYVVLRRGWRAGERVLLRLDLTPRLTYPDRRIDALRGCVAVERGPLVYCFEQTDNEDTDLADLEIPVDAEPRTVHREVAGLGALPVVELDAIALPSREPDGLPYATNVRAEDGAGGRATRAVAVPYFAWDNRGPGAMRVWMPVGARS